MPNNIMAETGSSSTLFPILTILFFAVLSCRNYISITDFCMVGKLLHVINTSKTITNEIVREFFAIRKVCDKLEPEHLVKYW